MIASSAILLIVTALSVAFSIGLFITNRQLRSSLSATRRDLKSWRNANDVIYATNRRYYAALEGILALRTDNMANIGKRMCGIAGSALRPSKR